MVRRNVNNLFIVDLNGVTPLLIASKLGRIENVKLIIQEQNKLISLLD